MLHRITPLAFTFASLSLFFACSSDNAAAPGTATDADGGSGGDAATGPGSGDGGTAPDGANPGTDAAADTGAGPDASVDAGGGMVGVRDTAFGTIGYRNTAAPARSILKAVPLPGRSELYLFQLHSSAAILGRGVTRFSEDGVLDTTYGTGGLFEKSDATLELSYRAFTVDSQGRAYFAGWPAGPVTGSTSGTRGAQIVRLTASGAADATFGGAAGTYVNPTDNATHLLPRSHARVMVTLPNDDLLIAGTADAATGGTATRQWIVFKVKPTGDVDTTFGDGGVTKIASGLNDAPHLLHVSAAGEIFVVGKRDDGPKTTVVAKVSASGTRDSSYGAGGFATVGTGVSLNLFDVAADASGALVAVGQATGGNGKLQALVTKLTTGGQVDSTFGTTGQTFINYYETFAAADKQNDLATRVWFDGAGRLMVGGYALDKSAGGSPLAYSTITRLTAGGAFDTSFDASTPVALAKVTNAGFASRFLADNVWDVGEIRPVFPSADGKHVYGVLLQANTTVHTFVRWR